MEVAPENTLESVDPSPSHSSPADPPTLPIFGRRHWLPFVLPLLVYMLSGQLEPVPPSANLPAPPTGETDSAPADAADNQDTAAESGFGLPYTWYPLVYTARILLTLAVMALALPAYRLFPFRVSPMAIGVGIVGIVVWVGVCSLALEQRFILPALSGLLGESGGRAAYNPLEQLGQRPAALAGFLAVRFLGLALVVPIIEEFFLRGFLVRFVQQAQWWKLPIGAAGAVGWLAVIVYAAASHPGEMFAAVLWFSLVTWLVARTGNIWDAVAAHAVTNLLLGVYVLWSGDWRLW